ncbi:MAG: RNA methyltransferase [Lachnospiraceae bacterium]|nr:RNA methyltransferase [Lachnospiraceae bacterium]
MSNIIEIKDFSDPDLDVYARLNENQLRTYYEPNPGIFIAESPNVIERALNAGYEPISLLIEKNQLDGTTQSLVDRNGHIPVFTAETAVISKLTGFAMTRGLLCAMRRKQLPTVSDICANSRRVAVLENVMNPTNVGAIFRSAAALGMDAVLLTHGCSDPLYRRSSRVSMGTVFQIPWTWIGSKECDWPLSGMRTLKDLGFQTAAMALSDIAVNIDDPNLMAEEKLAVILGTEGDGLCKQTIADCDYTVCIPMAHGVDSLNVAAASAVAFWQLGNK